MHRVLKNKRTHVFPKLSTKLKMSADWPHVHRNPSIKKKPLLHRKKVRNNFAAILREARQHQLQTCTQRKPATHHPLFYLPEFSQSADQHTNFSKARSRTGPASTAPPANSQPGSYLNYTCEAPWRPPSPACMLWINSFCSLCTAR